MKVRLIAVLTALVGIAAAFTFASGASASIDDCSATDKAVADHFGVPITSCDDYNIYSTWKNAAPAVQTETFNGTVKLSWDEHYGLDIASRTGGYNIHRQSGDGPWVYVTSVPRGTLRYTDIEALDDVENPGDLTTVKYRLRTYISSNNQGDRLDKNLFSESGPVTSIDVAQSVVTPAQPSTPTHRVGSDPLGESDGDYDIFRWDRDMTVTGYHIYVDDQRVKTFARGDSTASGIQHWIRTDGTTGQLLRDNAAHTYTVEAYLDLADGNTILSERSEPLTLQNTLDTRSADSTGSLSAIG